MTGRLGWWAGALVATVVLLAPAQTWGGDKIIEVGKEKEIKDSIKEDDPKVPVDVGGVKADFPGKVYLVKMEAGKAYRIAVNKDMNGLDPLLVVQDKDGKQLAFDDDGGGDLNSLLTFAPAATGVYKVCPAALSGAGGFTLKITAGEAPKLKRLAVGADGAKAAGSLTKEANATRFEVPMEEGKSYQIDLMSKDFDAWLTIESPTGAKLAEDDDGGDGTNSRLVFRAPSSGVYRIVATSLGMRSTGDFVLEVKAK